MKDIPLNAIVECTDGYGGRSTCVIVEPETLQVTHYVVKQEEAPFTERLAPVDQVEDVTAALIRLRCTKSQLKDMKEFTITEFRQVEIPRYVGAQTVSPYAYPEIMTLPVERERTPAGHISIHEGVQVKATDGRVGQVKNLTTDSDSGQITHFIMQGGSILGQKDVVIPLSAVESFDGKTAYLKVDKETLASMLAIPSQAGYGASDMELVILTLREADQIKEAFRIAKQLPKKESVRIFNVAAVVRDKAGQIILEETEDVNPRQGAMFGAITGGLIGLVAGPIGAIAGATAGYVTGRAAAGRIDMGFSDEYLKKLQVGLQPGNAVLVVLVERQGAEKVTKTLAHFGGQIGRQALTDDLMAKLNEAEGTRNQ